MFDQYELIIDKASPSYKRKKQVIKRSFYLLSEYLVGNSAMGLQDEDCKD